MDIQAKTAQINYYVSKKYYNTLDEAYKVLT